LATLADPAEAQICAALLRSAGIESRLAGESLGPYRLTVGGLAATEVWVPAARLEEARLLVEGEAGAVAEMEPGPASPGRPASPGAGARWWPVVGALALALVAWRLLDRLL
jgi:hypothetical protein